MRMAKAKKDVFSVCESVKAAPFWSGFLLVKIAITIDSIPDRVKSAPFPAFFLIPNLELSKKVCIFAL